MMSQPRLCDWVKLKRVARHLKGNPQVYILYVWQERPDYLDLFTDSDWANCEDTRKSHSGGLLLWGAHLLGHWTKIQPRITLSSGEAELYSSVKGLGNALGMWNLMREMMGGDFGKLRHHVDASACKAMLLRKRTGTMEHLETKDLWVQKTIKRRMIEVIKIPRSVNMSDSLASRSTSATLWAHMEKLGMERQQLPAVTSEGGGFTERLQYPSLMTRPILGKFDCT